MGEYRSERDASYLIGSIASLLSAGGLAVYGNMFLRKTKGL
jgi:hypothetical protein